MLVINSFNKLQEIMHGSNWNWLMLVTPGLFPGIESEPGCPRGELRLHQCKLGLTVAKALKPVCHGGVLVQQSGVLMKPRFVPEWPVVVPVTHGPCLSRSSSGGVTV